MGEAKRKRARQLGPAGPHDAARVPHELGPERKRDRELELGLVRPRDPAWTPFLRSAIPDGFNPEHASCWVNSRYQVLRLDFGALWWLSIKRRDKLPIHDWRELERIKNEVVGPERSVRDGRGLMPDGSRQRPLGDVAA
jgi:hypothetical protein